jgi:hypothetical protein
MRRRLLVGAAVLGVALSASVLAPAPAQAAPGLPAGTGAGAGELNVTCNSATYPVPAGVHLVSAVLTGASGGDVGFASGGVGGRIEAVLGVFPGQVLTIDAGCAGSGPLAGTGYGNGGDGGSATIVDDKSGGGGGGSGVRIGDTVLLAAGGGGGGNSDSGFSGSGGNGGHPAQPGHPTNPAWGGCGGCETGPDGGAGGANDATSGGGGGGGYRGGSGGAPTGTGGGGGGGSSYADPRASGVTFGTAERGHGSVQLVPTAKFEHVFSCAGGATVPFTVPNGWFDMHVEAIGGAGGSTHPHHTVLGGLGGSATATRTVTPGEHFEVTVGCQGDDLDHEASTGRNGGASGWGVGGPGGDAYTEKAHATGGAGGGGASALLQGGHPLVIAGGGGGAAGTLVPNDNLDQRIPQGGKGTVGGHGGDPPQPGADCPDDVGNGVLCFGGGGGAHSTSHGAAGQAVPVECPDSPSSNADASAGAGGGGGGEHGGGGGHVTACFVFGTNAGGGGGSSWIDPSLSAHSFGVAQDRGDGNVILSLTPRKGPTSTGAVTSTPAAPTLGDTPTFTTTVGTGFTGVATPTGTVQFVLDDTPLGGPVDVNASGVATSPPAPVLTQLGAHSITATYSGDASYEPSSVTSPVFVGPTTSSTPVTVTPTPLAVGQGVSAKTTVVPGWAQGPTPTGTVSFTIDGVPIGCPPNTPGGCPQEVQADGSASAGPSEPVAYGVHTVVASYSGDANYQPSTGSTTVFAQSDVALGLTATYTTVWPWETLTFTATPRPTDPTVTDVPTGTVTLTFDNGKPLPAFGGGTVPALSLTNGTVTTPTIDQATMGFGEHTVLATYSGDAHFQPFQTSLGILVIDAEEPGAHVAPTVMHAEPPRLRRTPSGQLIMKVRASLSASTEPFPIRDQTVTFRTGDDRRLCVATTDDEGVARCRIHRVGRMFLTLAARGYVASFAGSGAFGPASDDAPFFE